MSITKAGVALGAVVLLIASACSSNGKPHPSASVSAAASLWIDAADSGLSEMQRAADYFGSTDDRTACESFADSVSDFAAVDEPPDPVARSYFNQARRAVRRTTGACASGDYATATASAGDVSADLLFVRAQIGHDVS